MFFPLDYCNKLQENNDILYPQIVHHYRLDLFDEKISQLIFHS
uniref:Uncharacterized protein n=1 Tax=Podoviridae sp. cttxo15 TaxID=2826584 RepID=A0A8S5N1H6_9CAUD|nr:MAG TPA: hypothetical protein [Podoviridae sp. cttxo15]